MSKNSPSKDGSFEALDFILNIIKEHDKDLDRVATELASIAKRRGEKGDLRIRIAKIEDQIDSLQKDVDKLSKILVVRSG
jgi:hypothetical protein